MTTEVEEAAVTCIYCGCTEAEPEVDGTYGYWHCPECDGDFGYRSLAPSGPVCAAGLPVRPAEAPETVFLGAIGRRPE